MRPGDLDSGPLRLTVRSHLALRLVQVANSARQIMGLKGAATDWYAAFGGDVDLLGAYWASMMQIAGMAVSIYVVTLMLRLHHDEAQGTLEPVLATAVSRLRWLGAYALNALAGATVLMLGFALAMSLTGGSVLGGTGPLLGDLIALPWYSSRPSPSLARLQWPPPPWLRDGQQASCGRWWCSQSSSGPCSAPPWGCRRGC